MANRDERYRYDGYEDFNFSDGIRYEHLHATKHGRTLKAYCNNVKKDHNYDRLYNCVDEDDIEDEQTDYLECEHEDSEWEETDDEGSYCRDWEYPESECAYDYNDWPFYPRFESDEEPQCWGDVEEVEENDSDNNSDNNGHTDSNNYSNNDDSNYGEDDEHDFMANEQTILSGLLANNL